MMYAYQAIITRNLAFSGMITSSIFPLMFKNVIRFLLFQLFGLNNVKV